MDSFLFAVPIFIFGTIMGSFLNVVIYRYNSGTSFLSGRSQCFTCGENLSWYELIPLFSFLAQAGKCRTCKSKISFQYPLVEMFTGFIFVAVFFLGKPMIETIFLLVIFSTLLVIGVYDMRHQIIPDGPAIVFALTSIFLFLHLVPGGFREAFSAPYYWTLLAGPILFFPFWFLWYISKGRWIGFGDGKIAFGIGWFLGLAQGGSAIMLAFWIGALYAVTIMAVQKIMAISVFSKVGTHRVLLKHTLSLQSEIPFGPFLILGLVIIYVTGINFFDGSFNLLNFL
ncbi:hypothetical protein AUJ77_00605 [Candidatus Nomurabacteria bacterium CG1_02_43_90]|uniref:Peptidase A24A N-terminal domain-containing protein n=1 Tax=Candidatus Nomurabacteria bacterium CG1_02_43_90 TaxID=1805281 RepID=A0A1J4V1T0_9BACT|nr:MAG: hypothetical protein AUJ77_00605 [Candidatus Nomurabacteria bacterium CG1_02_43_90]